MRIVPLLKKRKRKKKVLKCMIKQFTTLLRQLSQFLMNCRSKQQLFHISAVSYCLLFDGLIFGLFRSE